MTFCYQFKQAREQKILLTTPSARLSFLGKEIPGAGDNKRAGAPIREAFAERNPGHLFLKIARQKQPYFTALALIIALAHFACSPPAEGSLEASNGRDKSDASVLKFEPDSVEFGTLKNDKPQITRIVGTNSSDTAVHISQVKTSCGCLLAKFSETEVLPGKQTTLRVLLDPVKADPEFEVHVSIFYEERTEVDVIPIRGRLTHSAGGTVAPER